MRTYTARVEAADNVFRVILQFIIRIMLFRIRKTRIYNTFLRVRLQLDML